MFVAHIVLVFREVWRVLRKDGTAWVNFGDTFCSTAPGTMGDNLHIEGTKEATKRARKIERRQTPNGLKPKDLVGIPWRVAFALQADGWYLRMDNIWSKPNPMPESVKDRPTKAHEYLFLLSKSRRYYYDSEAIKEPMAASSFIRLSQNVDGQKGSERANGGAKTNGAMKAVKAKQNEIGKRAYTAFNERYFKKSDRTGLRNKRSVWIVATAQIKESHFAVAPDELFEPCILASCPPGGRVLDPFGGSGTALKVALANNRKCTLIEINPDYIHIQNRRTAIIQTKLL